MEGLRDEQGRGALWLLTLINWKLIECLVKTDCVGDMPYQQKCLTHFVWDQDGKDYD